MSPKFLLVLLAAIAFQHVCNANPVLSTDETRTIIDQINEAIRFLKEKVEQAVGLAAESLKDALNKVTITAKEVVNKAKDVFNLAFKSMEDAINLLVEEAINFNVDISDCVKENNATLYKIKNDLFGSIDSCVDTQILRAKDFVQDTMDQINKNLDVIYHFQDEVKKCGSIPWGIPCLTLLLTEVGLAAAQVPITISAQLARGLVLIGDINVDLLKCGGPAVDTAISEGWEVTKTITSCIYNKFGEKEAEIHEDIENIISKIEDDVNAAIKNGKEKIEEELKKFVDKSINLIGDGEKEADKIKNDFDKKIDELKKEAELSGIDISDCIGESKAKIQQLRDDCVKDIRACINEELKNAETLKERTIKDMEDISIKIPDWEQLINSCGEPGRQAIPCLLQVLKEQTANAGKLPAEIVAIKLKFETELVQITNRMLVCRSEKLSAFLDEATKLEVQINKCADSKVETLVLSKRKEVEDLVTEKLTYINDKIKKGMDILKYQLDLLKQSKDATFEEAEREVLEIKNKYKEKIIAIEKEAEEYKVDISKCTLGYEENLEKIRSEALDNVKSCLDATMTEANAIFTKANDDMTKKVDDVPDFKNEAERCGYGFGALKCLTSVMDRCKNAYDTLDADIEKCVNDAYLELEAIEAQFALCKTSEILACDTKMQAFVDKVQKCAEEEYAEYEITLRIKIVNKTEEIKKKVDDTIASGMQTLNQILIFTETIVEDEKSEAEKQLNTMMDATKEKIQEKKKEADAKGVDVKDCISKSDEDLKTLLEGQISKISTCLDISEMKIIINDASEKVEAIKKTIPNLVTESETCGTGKKSLACLLQILEKGNTILKEKISEISKVLVNSTAKLSSIQTNILKCREDNVVEAQKEADTILDATIKCIDDKIEGQAPPKKMRY